MNLPHLFASPIASRRDLLRKTGCGLGTLALAASSTPRRPEADPTKSIDPSHRTPGHFAGKAKSVILIFANGGPSHVDTWDYKPELVKRDGKKLEGFDNKTGFFPGEVGPLMKSPFAWKQHGGSGTWVPEIFPNLAKHVDKMAFVHSCWTETNNHAPALFQINTGLPRMGFPCVGSWVTYGLGSESRNLPAFVVMYDTLGRGLPKGNAINWGAGFLPGIYQGTALNPQGVPIDNPSSARRGWRPLKQRADNSTCSACSTQRIIARTARPRPNCRPASRRSSWPTACRLAVFPEAAGHSRRAAQAACKTCTASTTRAARTSRNNASWLGEWSSEASASSRSTVAAWRTSAAGTASPTSPATTANSPARPTSPSPPS